MQQSASLPAAGELNARRLKLLVAGAVLAMAVAYLMMTAFQSTSVYYITVSELLGRGEAAYAQSVRLSGHVVPGSIEKVDGGLGVRFTIYDESGRVPVVYRSGPVPDIFGDDVQVVVEGKLAGDGTFNATTLLAKCPSKFESTEQTT